MNRRGNTKNSINATMHHVRIGFYKNELRSDPSAALNQRFSYLAKLWLKNSSWWSGNRHAELLVMTLGNAGDLQETMDVNWLAFLILDSIAGWTGMESDGGDLDETSFHAPTVLCRAGVELHFRGISEYREGALASVLTDSVSGGHFRKSKRSWAWHRGCL